MKASFFSSWLNFTFFFSTVLWANSAIASDCSALLKRLAGNYTLQDAAQSKSERFFTPQEMKIEVLEGDKGLKVTYRYDYGDAFDNLPPPSRPREIQTENYRIGRERDIYPNGLLGRLIFFNPNYRRVYKTTYVDGNRLVFRKKDGPPFLTETTEVIFEPVEGSEDRIIYTKSSKDSPLRGGKKDELTGYYIRKPVP